MLLSLSIICRISVDRQQFCVRRKMICNSKANKPLPFLEVFFFPKVRKICLCFMSQKSRQHKLYCFLFSLFSKYKNTDCFSDCFLYKWKTKEKNVWHTGPLPTPSLAEQLIRVLPSPICPCHK